MVRSFIRSNPARELVLGEIVPLLNELPLICFQLPSMRSQFISFSPRFKSCRSHSNDMEHRRRDACDRSIDHCDHCHLTLGMIRALTHTACANVDRRMLSRGCSPAFQGRGRSRAEAGGLPGFTTTSIVFIGRSIAPRKRNAPVPPLQRRPLKRHAWRQHCPGLFQLGLFHGFVAASMVVIVACVALGLFTITASLGFMLGRRAAARGHLGEPARPLGASALHRRRSAGSRRRELMHAMERRAAFVRFPETLQAQTRHIERSQYGRRARFPQSGPETFRQHHRHRLRSGSMFPRGKRSSGNRLSQNSADWFSFC